MAGEFDDMAGMNWVIRRPPRTWDHLARVWPDIGDQLGVVTEGVDDAIVSIGAAGWTETEQFNHFTGLRSQLDSLAADLDSLAVDWETGEW